MGLQGDTLGQDPAKFGLKFDGGKTKYHLVPMDIVKEFTVSLRSDMLDLENMYAEMLRSSNVRDIYYLMSMSYMNILSNVASDNSGLVRVVEGRNKALSTNISIIAACCIVLIKKVEISDHKLFYTLLDLEVVKALADLYTYGAELYSENNWQKVSAVRYLNATGRHIDKLIAEKRYDDESGMHHAVHTFWNLIALVYTMKHGGMKE